MPAHPGWPAQDVDRGPGRPATCPGRGSTSRGPAARRGAARRPARGPAAGRWARSGRPVRRPGPAPAAASTSQPALIQSGGGPHRAARRPRARFPRRRASLGRRVEGEDRHQRVGEQPLTARCRWAARRRPAGRREIGHTLDESAEQPRPARSPPSQTPEAGSATTGRPHADLRRCSGPAITSVGRRRGPAAAGGARPGGAARRSTATRPAVRAERLSGVRDQRLGEGQVDAHRARAASRARRPRPATAARHGPCSRSGSPPPPPSGEPHRAAEDPRLADRLVRAGADQLRGRSAVSTSSGTPAW